MDHLAERIKSAREDQGRTLRELAITTKIREPYIEAIEAGRYNVLPAVYVRSFIRTVALALGISTVEINNLMDEAFDSDQADAEVLRSTATGTPAPTHVSPLREVSKLTTSAVTASVDGIKTITGGAQSFISKKLLIVIAIAVLLVVGVGVWKLIFGETVDTSSVIDPNSIPELNVSDAISGSAMEGDSIVLTARVTDTVWLTITMDGKTTNQSVFMPGDEPHWSALKEFQLSLSNAGGVEFFRNGLQLPSFGNPGEAVRLIKITRTDAITSAQAFKSPAAPVSIDNSNAAPKPNTTPGAASKPTAVKPPAPRVTSRPAANSRNAVPPTRRNQQPRARTSPTPTSTRRTTVPIITPVPKQNVPVVPDNNPKR